MNKNIVYMDNAATTKVAPEVVEAMLPYFTEYYGNASSIYEIAGISKKAMNEGREKIANVIGAVPNEIYFTGGGSEADNWALKATYEAYKNKGNHIITTKVEHHAILHTCEWLEKQGYEVTYLDVDENGKISLEDLKAAIRPDTILISIMAANNEIGTIQPIDEIAEICHKYNVVLHLDCTQAMGKIYLNYKAADIITASSLSSISAMAASLNLSELEPETKVPFPTTVSIKPSFSSNDNSRVIAARSAFK